MSLDPEIAELVQLTLAAREAAGPVDLAAARAGYEEETLRLCDPGPAVAAVGDRAIPGPAGELGVRVYRPAGAGPLPVVAFLHGGGWVVGSLGTHDAICRALAVAAGALVVAVDYRLAPEHPYPAAAQDALAATEWLAAHAAELDPDADPTRLAVAGDSAGGNLAAIAARERPDLVRHQALIYPVLDVAMDTPSWREFATGLPLTAEGMAEYWRLYLDGDDGTGPLASPGALPVSAGLPSATILTAEQDVLRDEAEAYAGALRAAGVPVTLHRVPGTVHGWVRWQARSTLARDATARLGAALAAALA